MLNKEQHYTRQSDEFFETCKNKLDELLSSDNRLSKLPLANDYFKNIQNLLSYKKDYKSKLKLEIRFISGLAKIPSPSKDILMLQLEGWLNEFFAATRQMSAYDSDHMFSECIYTELLILAHTFLVEGQKLQEEQRLNAHKIYNLSIKFFSNNSKLANKLIFKKAELYLASNDTNSAFLCYRTVLKVIFGLFQNTDQVIREDDLSQIREALGQLIKAQHPQQKIYQQLLFFIDNKNNDNGTRADFISIAQHAMEINDYELCLDLFYFGNILKRIFDINPSLITHPSMSEIFNSRPDSLNQALLKLRHITNLIDAIEMGNAKKAIELIRLKISIEEKNQDGLTPLFLAVQYQQYDVVQAFIKAGIKPTQTLQTNDGSTISPLLLAVINQDLAMITLLTKEDSQIIYTAYPSKEVDHSILYFAIVSNYIETARLLIKLGACLKEHERNLLKLNHTYQTLFQNVELQKILIPLHISEILTPIFCIHQITGDEVSYLHFATSLVKHNNQRSVYAIRAPGLYKAISQPTTIEEMARTYNGAIRSIQPNGPYALIGASFGGWVVYEMAKQLISQGEEVILTGLIDTISPHSLRLMAPKVFAAYLLRVIDFLTKIMEVGPLKNLPDPEELAKFERKKQVDLVLKELTEAVRALQSKEELEKRVNLLKSTQNISKFEADLKAESDLNTHVASLLNSVELIRVNLKAAIDYSPAPKSRSPLIHCFNTSESIKEYGNGDESLGWAQQNDNLCIPITVDEATHFSILKKPHVDILAGYIATHHAVMKSDRARMAKVLPKEGSASAASSTAIDTKKAGQNETPLRIFTFLKNPSKRIDLSTSPTVTSLNSMISH